MNIYQAVLRALQGERQSDDNWCWASSESNQDIYIVIAHKYTDGTFVIVNGRDVRLRPQLAAMVRDELLG